MKKTALALAAAALMVAAAPAQAKDKLYTGKTDQGEKIEVTLHKGKWLLIDTHLPTHCVSAQGGSPLALKKEWTQRYYFLLGSKGRKTVKKDYPTTHYHYKFRRVGKRIKGKLHLNYSLLGSDSWGGYRILTCVGDSKFTVKPKR